MGIRKELPGFRKLPFLCFYLFRRLFRSINMADRARSDEEIEASKIGDVTHYSVDKASQDAQATRITTRERPQRDSQTATSRGKGSSAKDALKESPVGEAAMRRMISGVSSTSRSDVLTVFRPLLSLLSLGQWS